MTAAKLADQESAQNLHASESQAKPHINITPLIDVLLVVLIIFMVMSPLKPSRFLTKVPSKPDQSTHVDPPPLGLVVTIKYDGSLMLNGMSDMGSVNDTSKLSTTLSDLFQQRLQNHAYSYQLRDRIDLPEEMRIEKTVFIKAPRAIPYADVVRVLDGIKGAGANPVGLQIDDLN
ncbi:MAG TPA: biopolymer transporter ExbD [Pyrinomonadaceae bacterium]|nr:biopolymer transporter ExbD [Pyrinomonadaceae bacterium]